MESAERENAETAMFGISSMVRVVDFSLHAETASISAGNAAAAIFVNICCFTILWL